MPYRYAGFWKRAFAFLADKIILCFIFMIFMFIGLSVLSAGFSNLQPGLILERFFILYYLATRFLGMLYFTYFHGTVGQTPGKMIFGLEVIQASGEKMTPGLAFLRFVGYIISGLFFCLGFFWVAFDGKKQGWHDKIAGTLVIYKQEERIDSQP